ncbi:MAG TPA: type II toxin-antitoxin system RelE/ParE family toxin [Xanthobacteraceae bacterium]|nr:type II toxin-antitoxin system RelE/ParE family toxin [Xanthobacteraceae bacterium]
MSFLLSPRARDDLQAIDRYVRERSPAGAADLARRFLRTFERLSDFPESGLRAAGGRWRTAVVPATRYLISYRIRASGDVEILGVFHAAQKRSL